MSKHINPINWDEIMNKYKNHNGTIRDFCKNNNIKERQFYHHRKKQNLTENPTLHKVILNNTSDTKLEVNPSKTKESNIIVEIGNSKIYIPQNNTAMISSIVKELIKSC